MLLTPEYAERRQRYHAIAREIIKPVATEIESKCQLPAEVICAIAEHGFFGGLLPTELGGLSLDFLSFGFAIEALGAFSSSVRNLLTVHSMVSATLLRWGNPSLRQEWLPQLASGKKLGAFALTEPESGSDFDMIQTRVVSNGATLTVTGTKTWISCGSIADLFLVFAKFEDDHVAVLIPRNSANVTLTPITIPLIGARASLLATLELKDVRFDKEQLVGNRGFGKIGIGAAALDLGRYTVAWGSIGMARACFEAALTRAKSTKRFGKPIAEHQLIAKMITEMYVAVQQAEFACVYAGCLKDQRDPESIPATYVAKYAATKALSLIGSHSVRMTGARGCLEDSMVARAYCDAPIMEIIEGSSELHEEMIADFIMQHA